MQSAEHASTTLVGIVKHAVAVSATARLSPFVHSCHHRRTQEADHNAHFSSLSSSSLLPASLHLTTLPLNSSFSLLGPLPVGCLDMTTAASSSTTVYFVSGANRGIGFGIVEKLAARPNSLVYAAAREPAKADKLQQLAKQRGNVRVVQLSVDSDADHAAAAKQVEAEAGRVDVLLANAGIAPTDAWQRTEILSIDKLRDHFEVNTVGPIRLFQAFFPLLGRSSQPRFVVVSTIRGSIQMQANYATAPGTTYGLSKAAVNFFTIRVHVEHPTIITFPVQPGQLQALTTRCYGVHGQQRRTFDRLTD